MTLETTSTPWSHDELQLIGAELGDTVCYSDEESNGGIGVIVMLTKTTIFVLNEENEIIKFGRVPLISADNKWELMGLAEKQLRISKKQWEDAKKQILQNLKTKGRKKTK